MQPVLEVTEGPERGQVFALSALVTAIGRDATCDARLSDMRVSRQHAEISKTDSDFELVDLDSSNGTWVNGTQVTKQALRDGDIVALGSTRMQFKVRKETREMPARRSHGETQLITLVTDNLFMNWSESTDVESLKRAKDDLETLYRLGHALNPLMETGQLVPKIMDTIFEEVRKVDRCSILLIDPETSKITGTASRYGRAVQMRDDVAYSQTMVDQVLRDKKAILTYDAMSDDRFRRGESIRLNNIHSAICAPMQYQKTILGVIQADTVVPEHRFTRDDLRLIASIGLQAGAALANAQLYEKLVYEKAELFAANQKLKSAQDKLIQSEKMAAVGQLASGIVHDIKNPMTVILGYIEIIRTKLEASAESTLKSLTIDDDLKSAEKGIQFCNEVITDLLKFARPSEPSKSMLDINELVGSTHKFIQVELVKARIKCQLKLAEGLPKIMADENQLKQVFINIILNAIQAMDKPTRELRISTELIRTGSGAQIRINIADNGRGMSEEQCKRAFDPFYTTKTSGNGSGGTGLGLSVSYALINSHGGSIEIKSTLGEGTTFSILLPITP